MKSSSILLALLFILISCGKEQPEGTIEGRWKISDFDTIRYEFTEDQRFTIYQKDDGTFPSFAEFQMENPDLPGHEWYKEGDLIVVDLNFGNYFKFKPSFKCDNMVVDLVDEEGSIHSSYHREGHDISSCN